MIAAEILIPSRSPDAPAVIQAAGRSPVATDFAQVLAQSMTVATPAEASTSDTPLDMVIAPTAATGVVDIGVAEVVLANLGKASIVQMGTGPASVRLAEAVLADVEETEIRLAEAGPITAALTEDEQKDIGPVEIERVMASLKADGNTVPAGPALVANVGHPMPAAPTAVPMEAPAPAILAVQPDIASDPAPSQTKKTTLEASTTTVAPVPNGKVALVTSDSTNPSNTIIDDATMRQRGAGQPIADARTSDVSTQAKAPSDTRAPDGATRKDIDVELSTPEPKSQENQPHADTGVVADSAVRASLVPTSEAVALQAPAQTSSELVSPQAATTSLVSEALDSSIHGAQVQAAPNPVSPVLAAPVQAIPVLATPSNAPSVVPPEVATPDVTSSEHASALPRSPDAASTAHGSSDQTSDNLVSKQDTARPEARTDTVVANAETANTTPKPDDGEGLTPSTEPHPDRIEDAPSTATPPQPTTLAPLAALIQPLIAPQSGATQETAEIATQTGITGSIPRQRGMAAQLASLNDSLPKQDEDASNSSDRLAATVPANGEPQDHQPVQSDGRQMDRASIETIPKDSTADQGAPLTTTTQPLPLDNRAAPPATTPRGPETPPLDTTQSGWEAALTERITTRSTELGQEIEITLTPDNLGTVRIKLDLSDKVASVQIVTDTPQAAQLFQQSEARLTEAFNRAGLSLTSHDASSRDPGNGGQRQGQNAGNPRAEAALAGLRGTLTAPVQTGRAANLVNIVA